MRNTDIPSYISIPAISSLTCSPLWQSEKLACLAGLSIRITPETPTAPGSRRLPLKRSNRSWRRTRPCSLPVRAKRPAYMFTDQTVREGRVQIVKNGINAERFRFDPEIRKTVRQELGLQDKFVVGQEGRFYKQKNHAFLIRIFEKIHEKEPESVLLLFGKGDLETGGPGPRE